tara:strand:- start:3369 stop:3566 length:198 start_codon:yes stop_codon:yes gene_type:complete
MKKDTRRDAWNFDYIGIKAYFKKEDRPHWEVMADDGMNKFLKFCIACIFLYGGYQVIVALIDRFS